MEVTSKGLLDHMMRFDDYVVSESVAVEREQFYGRAMEL